MEPQETPPVEVPAPPPATPAPPPSVFSSPLLWLSIGIIILMMIGIAFYYFVSSRQHMTPVVVRPSITTVPTTIATPPTTEPTQSAQASPSASTSDLPPLFPGVEWEATTSGKITVYKMNPYGPAEIDGYRVESMQLATYPSDVVDYYKKELGKRQWNLAAETDNVIFYENKNKYFAIGVDKIGENQSQYKAFIEYN